MRTFIAIEISDEIRDALVQIQSHLKYAGADVKWVEKQNIHLTLKFLGEITDKKCDEVKAALDEAGRTTKQFEIDVKELGVFPKIDYPRVIWVGLNKGVNESKELAAKIEEALSRIGFQKESRPFAAHLTIGRVRSSKNKAVLKEKIESYDLRAASSDLSQPIDSIILFQSTLMPNGPIYTKLHDAKLNAP
jgi:RNA 2',3'-cyclic 3'-phosphodiesterase